MNRMSAQIVGLSSHYKQGITCLLNMTLAEGFEKPRKVRCLLPVRI